MMIVASGEDSSALRTNSDDNISAIAEYSRSLKDPSVSPGRRVGNQAGSGPRGHRFQGGRDRQAERKTGAPRGGRAIFERRAMCSGNGAADRQAQSRSFGFGRPEGFEQVPLHERRQPLAIVA